ncbi:thiamine pyrophosphokinase [Fusarium phyllophilum]|uniref:Thiamine pyrophosphokinase n=1 Tax=Fusarium phyllophilum TaxID=47803 RepID=A0A8H5IKW1_9HYPO|nr:thiamine pyrophosphokinase [Fusarium phyllophilum]
MAQLWRFHLPGDDRVFGFLTSHTVAHMPWTNDFQLRESTQSVELAPKGVTDLPESSAAAIARLLKRAQDAGSFSKLDKWPGEKFPVLGAPFPFAIDRAIAPFFGIVSTGVQLTVYVRGKGGLIDGIWLARRGIHKSTYAGMLDNAVGGAVEHGEMPFTSLMREAEEELGIDASAAVSGGAVSWFNVKGGKSGLHPGLVEPGVQYVYDLEVESNVTLSPAESGIEWLRLLSIDKVKAAILQHEFKPSCACVMIDLFVRHGIINAENERDFAEIVSRLHRQLLLPTDFPHTEGR